MIWVKEATTFVKLYKYQTMSSSGSKSSLKMVWAVHYIEATDICETLQTLCHVITRLWFQPQNLLWQRPLGDDLSQALQRGYYIYETLPAVFHVIIMAPSPPSKDLGCALQRGYYICETLPAVYHVIIRLQVHPQKIWAVHYKEATTFVKLHKRHTMSSSSGSNSSSRSLFFKDHLAMTWAVHYKKATDICETQQTPYHIRHHQTDSSFRIFFGKDHLVMVWVMHYKKATTFVKPYKHHTTPSPYFRILLGKDHMAIVWAMHYKEAATFVKLCKQCTMSSSGSKSSLKRSGLRITKRLLHLWNSASSIPCHHQAPSPAS